MTSVDRPKMASAGVDAGAKIVVGLMGGCLTPPSTHLRANSRPGQIAGPISFAGVLGASGCAETLRRVHTFLHHTARLAGNAAQNAGTRVAIPVRTVTVAIEALQPEDNTTCDPIYR